MLDTLVSLQESKSSSTLMYELGILAFGGGGQICYANLEAKSICL